MLDIVDSVFVTFVITKNNIDTRSHDTAINVSPIAAFFKTFNPSPNFLSSPAAVTIWNHAQSKSTKVINPNVQSHQLIAFLITFIRASPLFSHLSAPSTHLIHLTNVALSQNPFFASARWSSALTKANLGATKSPNHKIKTTSFLNIIIIII